MNVYLCYEGYYYDDDCDSMIDMIFDSEEKAKNWVMSKAKEYCLNEIAKCQKALDGPNPYSYENPENPHRYDSLLDRLWESDKNRYKNIINKNKERLNDVSIKLYNSILREGKELKFEEDDHIICWFYEVREVK